MSQPYESDVKAYEKFVIKQRFLNPAKDTARFVKKFYSPNNNILDIGTGTGVVLVEIDKLIKNARLLGLDNSTEMLKLTKKKGFDLLVYSKLPTIPFLDNSFNVITANFVLSHIPEYKKTLSEIRRVLEPKGTFILSTWAGGQKKYNKIFNNRLKKFISTHEYNKILSNYLPNEEYFGTKKNISNVLSSSGLIVKEYHKKIYRIDLSLSDYLNCRLNLLVSKRMKQFLSKELWEKFTKELHYDFVKEVGTKITYKGTVDFYICGYE